MASFLGLQSIGDGRTEYSSKPVFPNETGLDFPNPRLLLGFHQSHRNADDPPHNVRVSRIRESPHFAFRLWVRNRVQIAVEHLAPTANEFSAQFHEVDWPVVFVLPFALHDLTLILIDLHDRTGPDNREHGSVGKAHEPVNAMAKVEVLEQANRNLTPYLAQFGQQIGAIQLELLV